MSREISLSEELRRRREHKNLSLEEVQQQTGISATILCGLETGHLEVVEPAFMRLGLHTYAAFLGLDAGEMVRRFQLEIGSPAAPSAARSPVPFPSGAASLLRRLPRSWSIALGSALALLILLLLFRSGGGRDTASPAARLPAADELSPAPPAATRRAPETRRESVLAGPQEAAPGAGREASPDLAEEAAPALAPPQSSSPPPPDGGAASGAQGATAAVEASSPAASDSLLVLEMEAVYPTWVHVRGDGREEFSGELPAGARRRLEARDSFLVHAGRAHGVRYWFQGRLLGEGRLGEATRVLRFQASKEGVVLLGPHFEALEAHPTTADSLP